MCPDTLSLSFGRDDKVVVMRKLKTEFTSKGVVGNTKKDRYQYEVAVRNNRSTPIRIEIYDQVPISTNSDISVVSTELSGGMKDEETGEVKWSVNIPAGGVQGKEIGYIVKYPKNTSLQLQRFRTVSCPSF